MNKFYFIIDNNLYFGYEDEKDAYEIQVTQTTYSYPEEKKIFMDFEIDKNGYAVLKEIPEVSEVLEKIINNEIKTLEDVVKVIKNMGFIEEKDEDDVNYDLEPKKKNFGDSIKRFFMLDSLL